MATTWVKLRTIIRLEVLATAALLALCHCAAALAETPEQRFAKVRQASLQRHEMRVNGRDVTIKLVVLACDAECRSADVIEVSELGDIRRIWRPAGTVPISGEGRFPSTSALRQPRRDQVMRLAAELQRTKPQKVRLPVERRLLLAYRADDRWMERTFDRKNLNTATQSLVRELAAERYLDFGPWVPRIKSAAKYQPDHRPESAAFAATEDVQLLASVQDHHVILLDSNLRRLRSVRLPEPLTHPAPIELIGRAAFSPDNKWLAVATYDKRIIVLDVQSWTVAANILHEDRVGVREVFFTRDSEALVVRTDSVSLLHAGRWSRLDDYVPAGVVNFSESPDGKRALMLLSDGSLRLRHHRRSPKAREQAEGEAGILLAERCGRCLSAFSPDGSLVAAMINVSEAAVQPRSVQTKLKVWRVSDGAEVADLQVFGMPIQRGKDLQWHPNGTHLLAVGEQAGIRRMVRSGATHLWNAIDGRHVAELVGPHRPIGLAASDRHVFVADYTGQVFRWDLDDLPNAPASQNSRN